MTTYEAMVEIENTIETLSNEGFEMDEIMDKVQEMVDEYVANGVEISYEVICEMFDEQ